MLKISETNKKGFVPLEIYNAKRGSAKFLTGFTPLETIGRGQKAKASLTGFTLIEIIVSVFILSLVITGLAYVFLAAKQHIVHSRSKITGAELGRLFLAPLQGDVRQDQWGSNCLSNVTGCPGNQTVDNITYTPTYDITNLTGTTLRKVKVSINWTETAP